MVEKRAREEGENEEEDTRGKGWTEGQGKDE